MSEILYGGSDKYNNLIFVTQTVHKLIHSKDKQTINYYLSKIKTHNEILKKINYMREQAMLKPKIL